MDVFKLSLSQTNNKPESLWTLINQNIKFRFTNYQLDAKHVDIALQLVLRDEKSIVDSCEGKPTETTTR
jgi:hypothetical protein